MTPAGHLPAALALVAAALLLWSPADRPVRARARALAAARSPAGPPLPERPVDPRRRWLLATAAGIGTLLLVGGPVGAALGIAVAVGLERVLRRSGDADARRVRAALEDELPVACDLLAVCLTAGLPVGAALAAVAGALPGPLGRELGTVAGRYRLGSSARAAWADVAAPLAGLGRVVARAGSPAPPSSRRCRDWPPTAAPPSAPGPRPGCARPGCGCSPRSAPASCRRSSAWASPPWCSASPPTSCRERPQAGGPQVPALSTDGAGRWSAVPAAARVGGEARAAGPDRGGAHDRTAGDHPARRAGG